MTASNLSQERASPSHSVTVIDLAGVVYSAGKVFDGLSASRAVTERFLRTGSLDSATSRSDRELLQDLRDVAQFIIEPVHAPINAMFVRGVNAQIAWSGALHPGRLKTRDQAIGVQTRYGRHTPRALTEGELQQVLDGSFKGCCPLEDALDLFIDLAKAQPFEDGNKRTALFVANHLLVSMGTGVLLTVPSDDGSPRVADSFNDMLARAYIYDEHDGVKDLLRKHGTMALVRARAKA